MNPFEILSGALLLAASGFVLEPFASGVWAEVQTLYAGARAFLLSHIPQHALAGLPKFQSVAVNSDPIRVATSAVYESFEIHRQAKDLPACDHDLRLLHHLADPGTPPVTPAVKGGAA